MPLQLFLFMDLSFRILVPVLFELMVVRRHVFHVALLIFLWRCCCQYQVGLLFNGPGICLSFLDYLLVCLLLRFYSGLNVWRCTGLMTGVSSINLGIVFLMVPKCRTIVVSLQGLQLVWRLCSI